MKLYSLERRRLRGDLIEVFKILSGLEGIEEGILFQRSKTINHLRGHSKKLFKPALKKGLFRKYFFSIRTINEWNNLPGHVVNAETTNIFKSKLDALWYKNGYGVTKA